METRPFLKRLLKPFLKTKSKLEQPAPTSHIFPLSPPKTRETNAVPHRRRIKLPYRPSPPSNDPRFNHALRPSHIARALARSTLTVEKLPDSCLPSDDILASLGYEKLD